MSDDEDDYLSDKFLLKLAEPVPSTSTRTYSQRRKEAERLSAVRNEQNRKKSRRVLELEAREAGLSKSLFERAQEEVSTAGQQNKALAMMMKMGFTPGQSLGRTDPEDTQSATSLIVQSQSTTPAKQVPANEENAQPSACNDDLTSGDSFKSKPRHLVAPLPLNEWTGRSGIGVRKRAASPNAAERLAKMAKMAEDHKHLSFRDRARQEYEERQAEGRLGPARRTCLTLDEKAGRQFNVLWLDSQDPDSFPDGLIDLLEVDVLPRILHQHRGHGIVENRLHAQMQADALRPLEAEVDETSRAAKSTLRDAPYSEGDLEECTAFLQLTAKDRLSLVLRYLRERYTYCFWCGTQYVDLEDMEANCPGPEEEAHD